MEWNNKQMWKKLGCQSNSVSRQLTQGVSCQRKPRPFVPKTCAPDTPRKSITSSGIFTDRQRRQKSRDRSMKKTQNGASGSKLAQFAKVLTKNDHTIIMDDDFQQRRLKNESTKGKLSTEKINPTSNKITRRSSILKTSNICKSYIEEDSDCLIFGQQKPVIDVQHPLFGIEAAVHCSGASNKEQYENKISRGVQIAIDQTNYLTSHKEIECLRKTLSTSEINLKAIRTQVVKFTSEFYSGMHSLEDRKQRILAQMKRLR